MTTTTATDLVRYYLTATATLTPAQKHAAAVEFIKATDELNAHRITDESAWLAAVDAAVELARVSV